MIDTCTRPPGSVELASFYKTNDREWPFVSHYTRVTFGRECIALDIVRGTQSLIRNERVHELYESGLSGDFAEGGQWAGLLSYDGLARLESDLAWVDEKYALSASEAQVIAQLGVALLNLDARLTAVPHARSLFSNTGYGHEQRRQIRQLIELVDPVLLMHLHDGV